MNAAPPLPRHVIIEEEVLRDGLQNEKHPFSTNEKLRLIHALIDAGVKRIQVGSFVHPKWVPQMADTDEIFRRLAPVPGMTYTALVLNKKGLERAIACGAKHLSMSVSASETHSLKNTNCSTEEAWSRIESLILSAKEHGITVRAGVMTAFGCAYEGPVPPERVLHLVTRYVALGVDEINLADTAGLGNPRLVYTVVKEAKDIAGDIPISLHLHDTRGMGLANLLSGLAAGATIFDTCTGGLGGCPFIPNAAGNIATEDAVFMLNEMGIETGIDVPSICSITHFLEETLKRKLPSRLASLPFPTPSCPTEAVS